ncbi:MAG: hypothetical protein GSR85_09230 [Desulfurococcales archaeon]|nr:hypothetical protein [Desulfurococcales archaeon]
MPKRGVFTPKIVSYTAMIASSLIEPEELESQAPMIAKHVKKAIGNVGLRLRTLREGVYYCGICEKGPFTKKGYFLHLTRLHYDYILELVEDEAERIASASRRAGP